MTTDWWKLMVEAGEMAWMAPWVAQRRIARWSTADRTSTRQQRENLRMVTEKWEAGLESQARLWGAAWAMQREMATQFWRISLGLRPATWSNAQFNGMMNAAVRGARRSLAPARRRVRANARRLRG